MPSRIRFSVHISRDEMMRYYSGGAQVAVVTADDGRRVQLPASSLRPFVGPEGISGRFELTLDDNHKLLGITRLA